MKKLANNLIKQSGGTDTPFWPSGGGKDLWPEPAWPKPGGPDVINLIPEPRDNEA